jgi:hypothetical protein
LFLAKQKQPIFRDTANPNASEDQRLHQRSAALAYWQTFSITQRLTVEGTTILKFNALFTKTFVFKRTNKNTGTVFF